MTKLGFVYWVTGLSGAGKTTFAKQLQDALTAKEVAAVMIDGDAIRDIFGKTTDYSRSARLALAYKYAHLAYFLSSQGVNVICSTISLFHEIQTWNRKNINRYIEVFIDRAIDDIEKEDIKGIYARAKNGKIKDVVGIDIKPEFPKNPDLIVRHTSLKRIPFYVEKALNLL